MDRLGGPAGRALSGMAGIDGDHEVDDVPGSTKATGSLPRTHPRDYCQILGGGPGRYGLRLGVLS
jgi:hypothetical protein